MQIILSVFVWCAILSTHSPYRPVPMLDPFSDRMRQLQSLEREVIDLRAAGKEEQARKLEEMLNLLWKAQGWIPDQEPQRANPLVPPA